MMRFVMDTGKGEFSFDVIGVNNGVIFERNQFEKDFLFFIVQLQMRFH